MTSQRDGQIKHQTAGHDLLICCTNCIRYVTGRVPGILATVVYNANNGRGVGCDIFIDLHARSGDSSSSNQQGQPVIYLGSRPALGLVGWEGW